MPHLNKQSKIQQQMDWQFSEEKTYLQGKKDVLKSLREKLEKGYELQTVVESLEAEIEVESLLSKS